MLMSSEELCSSYLQSY